jgi:hypothetical protein
LGAVLVIPVGQFAQVRSAVAVPFADTTSPLPHSVHGAQLVASVVML